MQKYLALGDSIADGEEAFPAFLAKMLPNLEYINLARGGSRVPDLFADQLPRAIEQLVRKDVALITLVIGANDVLGPARDAIESAGESDEDANALWRKVKADTQMMEHNYDALLSILRTVAGPTVPIVVLTYYNPYPDSDFMMHDLAGYVLEDSEIGINTIIRKLATKYAGHAVDTEWAMIGTETIIGDVEIPLMDLVKNEPILDEEGNPRIVTIFDVHPNKQGHENIAHEVFAELDPELTGVVTTA
jgi:lysophospholipase L1-like esterase